MLYSKIGDSYREQVEDEDKTKIIVIIDLRNKSNGFNWSFLNEMIEKAVGDCSNYKIFNSPEGLIVEKTID